MECLFDFQNTLLDFLVHGELCYVSLCLEEEVPSCIGSAAPRTAGGSCLTRSSKELPGYAKDVEHCCSFLHPDLSCSPDAVKSSKGKHAHTHKVHKGTVPIQLS